jgi:hypothetical protein
MLVEHGIKPPVLEEPLRLLNPFAVMYRYDDLEIEVISRIDTAIVVEEIRRWAGEQVRDKTDHAKEAGATND